ncbi:hypothetical [Prochlorococcus marinus str. MIT 9313]|uniref:Uncharacterized protein n=1 Tax=Prochlorococcus marinus (strain MIT 9313) TaxID=74547 RepID=Q7V8E3_PROMM|nr:hypothetical [Prochlorococcus marinus str. MIT 9313]
MTYCGLLVNVLFAGVKSLPISSDIEEQLFQPLAIRPDLAAQRQAMPLRVNSSEIIGKLPRPRAVATHPVVGRHPGTDSLARLFYL